MSASGARAESADGVAGNGSVSGPPCAWSAAEALRHRAFQIGLKVQTPDDADQFGQLRATSCAGGRLTCVIPMFLSQTSSRSQKCRGIAFQGNSTDSTQAGEMPTRKQQKQNGRRGSLRDLFAHAEIFHQRHFDHAAHFE